MKRNGLALALSFLLWLAIHPAAAMADGAGETLEVLPTSMKLQTSRDAQAFVVRLIGTDGIGVDVTPDVKLTLPPIVSNEGNVLRPAGDGKGQVVISYGNHTATIDVQVSQASEDRPISFKLDVMPVFMRAGCNAGACHGSARGKDGFHLSLFGFDPDGDYERITREMATRRINLALPEQSLLLLKPTAQVPHTGGERFKKNTPMYATLLRWIDAGAPLDPPTVAHPDSVQVLPSQLLLNEGTSQRLTVRAHYSDGTERDVTLLAVFSSTNDVSAAIIDTGVVTAARRGEAFVLARFSTFTVATQVLVVPKNIDYHFPDLPENDYIDTLVDAKLKKLRIVPSGVCDDQTFVRRAYLDLIGLLPTRKERDDFIADTHPDKRARLIDLLLKRPEFVDVWVMKWAELLQIRSANQKVSYKSTLVYYDWLKDQFSRDVPIDKIVQQLIDPSGGTFENPPTNYYEMETDTLKMSENTAQVFMGIRVQCAQCHNHPFDRWTMNDYYGFAAFFTQVGHKPAEDPREQVIFNSGGGEIPNPLSGQPLKAKFLGGDTPDTNGKDRRAVLAHWIASPQDPYFAPNIADIIWQHYMGKGIVEPVDDVRASNPPVNPELLAALSQHLQDYHFDIRKLVRDICLSRAYQTDSVTNSSNEMDARNYSHAPVRRMQAEVLNDAIDEVTDGGTRFRGLPVGSRAVQIADGASTTDFLTTFGRSSRESVCTCAVKVDPNLSQALELVNGGDVQNKVQNSPVIDRMLKANATNEQIIDELYLRCLSRPATDTEKSKLNDLVGQSPDRRQGLKDVFWALLNSQEFLFNH
jgi:hypothetical protein